MSSFLRASLVGALLAAGAMGQQPVAPAAPAAELPLAGGGQLQLGGPAAAAITVLAFHRSAAAACSDGDLLRALQVEFAAAPLRAAVVTPLDGERPRGLRDLAIVGDAEGALLAAWTEPAPSFHVVVVRDGAMIWHGEPGHGLAAVVARSLAGELDVTAEAGRTRVRQQLIAGFDNLPGDRARAYCRALLDRAPTDGLAWGLLWLAQQEKMLDHDAAQQTLQDGLAALADRPRALAAMADLVLRGSVREAALGSQLASSLTAAAAAAPDDMRVQLTRMRALVRAGGGREVGRLSHQLARKVEGVASHALEYVDILAQDRPAAIHVDLCRKVLLAAAQLDADPRLLTAARYVVELSCGEDRAAASEIGDPYFEALGGRVGLNNDAWYMMTELSTRGRFDAFALAMVERMLEERSAMEYYEFDTAALAMFLAGRAEEAVDLQSAAIEKGGQINPEYQERLRRYRAAAAAAPR